VSRQGKSKGERAPQPALERKQKAFAIVFGLLLGLALVKFGNPVVMEKFVDAPTNFYEALFNPWPAFWGYWLLAGVAVLGVMVANWRLDVPRILLVLPLVWLGWEFLAGTQTVDAALTRSTLAHFTTCVVCFYLGLFSLSQVKESRWVWLGIVAGFAWVLIVGLQQHFGGLEETRKYFFTYLYPTMKTVPPDYLKKMSSNRIFSTLFYPNALAGVVLLVLPGTIGLIWSMRERFTTGARGLLIAMLAAAAMACLYWSGSKGGWLLMLVIGLLGALILPFKRQLKMALVVAVLVLGLAGFIVKYSGFFKKGATSVVARFDYWHAAMQTTKEKPLFGTGPGTFAKAYEKIKKPESEMARLTHNDYLQQASDSGVIGFLAYASFIGFSIYFAYKRNLLGGDWLKLGIWLGVFGWVLQSCVEFGLYIPALAWLAFGLLGWLLGQPRNRIDTLKPPG
jgi:ABC-type multidrug transport system fused ATPase/permease subunit